jgi:hypothetical protein
VALRDTYAAVVGVGVLDPSGHDANLHKDPAFTRDLLGLKINQGGGGFRPYSERINFLNCMNKILPQMLDLVPKEGVTKKGLCTSLKDGIRPNSFGEVKKKYTVGTILLHQEKPLGIGLTSLSHSASTPPQRRYPHSNSVLEMGS